MDDLKREIYMLARKLIADQLKEDPNYRYGICCALEDAGDLLYGKGLFCIDNVPVDFPEFTNLNDGQDWTYEHRSMEFYAYTPKRLKYWWYVGINHKSRYGKKNPRLTALDFVLNNR